MLSLTQILRNSQLLLTGKMNNTGEDLSAETREQIRLSDLDAYEPLSREVFSTALPEKELAVGRYVSNKSYMSGLNYLISLGKNASLRFNILYYGDHSRMGDQYDNYYGGLTPFRLMENERLRQTTYNLLPIIKYELNGDHLFLSNELKYSLEKKTLQDVLLSNGQPNIERIKSKPSYLQDYFKAAFLLGKRVLETNTFIRYLDRSDNLVNMADSNQYRNLSEQLTLHSWVVKSKVSLSIPFLKNTLRLEARTRYTSLDYFLDGTMTFNNWLLQWSPSYDFSWNEKFSGVIDLPFGWSRQRLSSKENVLNTRSYFNFEPSVYLRYKWNDKWKVSLTAYRNKAGMPPMFYSRDAFLTNYRTSYLPTREIFVQSGNTIRAGLHYTDLARMLLKI